MKVLVTGGAGFIGSHVVEYFQGKAEIRVLDNLRSGCLRNLQGLEYEFMHGSILDRDLVRRAVEGVDYIFHMAAMISVPESMQKTNRVRRGEYDRDAGFIAGSRPRQSEKVSFEQFGRNIWRQPCDAQG